jgi:uncharacterized OsmC-like protein
LSRPIIHLHHISLAALKAKRSSVLINFNFGENIMTQQNTQHFTQANSDEPVHTNIVNGVDLGTLGGTVSAIQSDPELGACHFRATNQWVDGTLNRSTVSGFYGAKQEIAHKQNFGLVADEPAILAGNDDGANPVEHLLHALASCMTTSIIAHAAVRGVSIKELESELEGDIDLNGFLGLSEATPKGFTKIRVKFHVRADHKDMETIRALPDFSPVLNTLIQGVPVDVTVDQK